jgi:hypothetical protein
VPARAQERGEGVVIRPGVPETGTDDDVRLRGRAARRARAEATRATRRPLARDDMTRRGVPTNAASATNRGTNERRVNECID